jgi:general secretion pathway protein G
MAPDFFSGSPYFCVEEAGELDWLAVYPMHTLARLPAREARLNRQAGKRAFTLIELLTVIAIIAILAAITFGVVKGVNERAAIGQAKGELASLSQALELYKMQYGDYPRVGTSNAVEASTAVTATSQAGKFFNALMGKVGPKGDPINGRTFVDASRFSLLSATAFPTAGNTTSVINAFIDPWGRSYVYAYAAGWTTYRLASPGPDGKLADTFNATTGMVTVATAANGGADNIYANQ